LFKNCFDSCTVIYALNIRFLFTFYFCVGWRLCPVLNINTICRHIFLMGNCVLAIWHTLHVFMINFKKTIAWIVLLQCILMLIYNFLKRFNCIGIIYIAILIFIWLLSPYINETITFNNTIDRYLIKILRLYTMLT
jgi:hypothetical protein